MVRFWERSRGCKQWQWRGSPDEVTVLCRSLEQVMGKWADRGMRCIIAERISVNGMWHYQKYKHVTMRERKRWKWPSVARILHAYQRFGGVCFVLHRMHTGMWILLSVCSFLDHSRHWMMNYSERVNWFVRRYPQKKIFLSSG